MLASLGKDWRTPKSKAMVVSWKRMEYPVWASGALFKSKEGVE